MDPQPAVQTPETTTPSNVSDAKKKTGTGFKIFIGVLIVLGTLPFLAVGIAILLIMINPAQKFAQANDTQRRNDTLQILNAVWEYAGANQGIMPNGITSSPQSISSNEADICTSLVPAYLSSLPADPNVGANPIVDCSAPYKTGYQIQQDSTGRVTVTAPNTELTEIITVSR